MARQEQPREDLIRDAKALVERVELLVPASLCAQPVVAGRRSAGDVSLYFGDDPVYHFNASAQLRRAFYNGRLLKAEAGRLVSMERVRTPGEVQLRSHVLAAGEAQAIVDELSRRIDELASVLRGNGATLSRAVGDAVTADRVADWLVPLQSKPVEIASRPHVG